MKTRDVFYLILLCGLFFSFFCCKLHYEQNDIPDTVTEDQPPDIQRSSYWEQFCPGATFSGYNASGYYSCGCCAGVSAMTGGGTLTFIMTGGAQYKVYGSIIKQSNYSGGSFYTPAGSISAATYYKSIYKIWSSGNCSLSGSASGMGGGTYVKDLRFYRLITYQAPDYDPSYWNDGNADKAQCQYANIVTSETRQDNNNCYNYACNRDATIYRGKSPFAQPGASQDIFPGSNGNALKDAAIADGLEYFGAACPGPVPGKIIVALLVGSSGFHWCRKDSNEYWSHKNGREEATDRDYSGNRISNPQTADWGRYSFYGYFMADSGTDQGRGSETIEGLSPYPTNICN